jgi:hypothetical protein
MIRKQDVKWDVKERHHDDITAFDSCGESLVATGSFDGVIIIWNVKLCKAVNQFSAKNFRMQQTMSRFTDTARPGGMVLGCKPRFALDDAIGSHDCWVEANIICV